MRILETNNLLIREFLREDVPLVMQYSQESCKRNELPDEVFETMEQAADQINICIDNYAKKTYPLVYAIVLKESNLLIGDILLSPINEGIEIGYSIAEGYQGNGYAAEAIGAFAEWTKENIHQIKTLYGLAKKSNIASWKSLEKAGFVFSHEKELTFWDKSFVFKVYTY